MHERGGGGWPYKLFSMPISPLHHQIAAITAIDLIHPSSHQPASVSFEQEHAVAGKRGRSRAARAYPCLRGHLC